MNRVPKPQTVNAPLLDSRALERALNKPRGSRYLIIKELKTMIVLVFGA